MTLPAERTRALRWAWELLCEVQRSPLVPEELRRQARTILRHYPDARELQHAARYDPLVDWLGPEEDLPGASTGKRSAESSR